MSTDVMPAAGQFTSVSLTAVQPVPGTRREPLIGWTPLFGNGSLTR